ncbi:hypothetical protein VNO78_09072 [Psophocarpus tetragonolobus]|uniref:Uncharacterized protein n=1 Tax=Psophocarpus tetragonolobus TaxID=3891 RepID=A0AAN9SVP4_PSOTE
MADILIPSIGNAIQIHSFPRCQLKPSCQTSTSRAHYAPRKKKSKEILDFLPLQFLVLLLSLLVFFFSLSSLEAQQQLEGSMVHFLDLTLTVTAIPSFQCSFVLSPSPSLTRAGR